MLLFSHQVRSNSLWPHGVHPMDYSTPGCPVFHYLLEFAQTHVLWVGDATKPSHLLLPSSPFAFNPSQHTSLCSELALCTRWPKYWSFSFSISPSNEYSVLISFSVVWSPCSLRDSQESSSTPQFENISFLTLSLLDGPALTSVPDKWRNHNLIIWTFVDNVMSLLFNMPSRFVIAFLPRSKHLLILWLQSPLAVVLEPKKIKSVSASTFTPSINICLEMMGRDTIILVCWMLSFNPAFSLFSFTLIKRLFSSSSLSAIRVVSSAYLRLLIFLLVTLIPACDSSSPAFHMMHSAYELNTRYLTAYELNTRPCQTPFPILKQSVVPCPVLAVASWPAYRFLRRQVRWPGIPISWRISHSLLWSTQSKALLLFSRSVMSDSLWPHGLQHTKLLCLL